MWESVKKIAAHCKNFSHMAAGETYCRSIVEKSLALLRSQGVISDRYERELGGYVKKGFDFLDVHGQYSCEDDHGYCVFQPPGPLNYGAERCQSSKPLPLTTANLRESCSVPSDIEFDGFINRELALVDKLDCALKFRNTSAKRVKIFTLKYAEKLRLKELMKADWKSFFSLTDKILAQEDGAKKLMDLIDSVCSSKERCKDLLPKYGIGYGDEYVDACGGKGSQSTVVSGPEYGITSAQNPDKKGDGAGGEKVCGPELLLEAPKKASKLYITPPGTVQTVRTLPRSAIEIKPFSDKSASRGKEKGIFHVSSAANYYREELEPFEAELNAAYAMGDGDLQTWVKLLHLLNEVLKANSSPEFCAVRDKIFAERGEYLYRRFGDAQSIPEGRSRDVTALVEEFLGDSKNSNVSDGDNEETLKDAFMSD